MPETEIATEGKKRRPLRECELCLRNRGSTSLGKHADELAGLGAYWLCDDCRRAMQGLFQNGPRTLKRAVVERLTGNIEAFLREVSS